MLKILDWFLWLFKSKPPLLMERLEFKSLEPQVKFKMFAQGNLGLAILFKAFQELGNEEMCLAKNGFYQSRYRDTRSIVLNCWSTDFICFCIEQALDTSVSFLFFRRIPDARAVFYQMLGDTFKGNFSSSPEQGSVVLFPTDSKGAPRLAIVSRIQTDKFGKIKKWWYISGNAGLFISKVKECRGDKKKVEGFMNLSEVKW